MQVCRKCGAALRDTDKYCSQCGARAPSASVRARKEKAQKKKEQKEITFRTQPEKGTHYRENFEEGENRFHAAVRCAQLLRNDQRGVVAEGAAEVASAGENRAGNAAGIVQQRHLLQA